MGGNRIALLHVLFSFHFKYEVVIGIPNRMPNFVGLGGSFRGWF